MAELVSFDLSHDLAERIQLERLAALLLLESRDAAVTFGSTDGCVRVWCSVRTAAQISDVLRRRVLERGTDRDVTMTTSAVLRRIDAALDRALVADPIEGGMAAPGLE